MVVRSVARTMSARAIATIVAAMGLVLATAVPTSATGNDPNLRWWTKYVCATTYTDGTSGTLFVRATTDTSRRKARVQYSIWGFDGPRHSAIDMPIGPGRIMVLRQEYTAPEREGGFLAERPEPHGARRYECRAPSSGAYDLTSDIVYIRPPVKPTIADVEAYCAEFARENPGHDEAQRCVPYIVNKLEL
jgi:hypothetical protein